MKIILCLNHFLPARVAGIEVYTFNLAKSLQSLGTEVCVVTPHFDSESDQYFYEGIKVRRYKENSENSRDMAMGRNIPLGLPDFMMVIRDESPTVVHFQEVAAGRGISLHHLRELALSNIKMILTCHLSTYSCDTGNLIFKEKVFCDGIIRTHTCTACSYYSKGLLGLRNELLQTASQFLYNVGINALKLNSTLGTALGYPFLIKKKKRDLLEFSQLCERIVVLTKFYKEILQLNNVPREKIRHIAQGISENIKPKYRLKTEKRVKIVFVGRICEDKGVHLLIEALNHISQDKLTLDIYGPITEPHYFEECKILSRNLKNVTWKGAVEQGVMLELLSSYHLLCLPSTFSEMSPLVIQEAFAAGIPVLASNVYGNAEQIVHGKNGWLFEFKNAKALRMQIDLLLNDPELIDAVINEIQTPKDFASVAIEHVSLYEEIFQDDLIKSSPR